MTRALLERVKQEVHYDENTGVFTWLKTGKGRGKVGEQVGNGYLYKGYQKVQLFGARYLAHRLAWFYVNGCWPENQIDHINGIRNDNRIANLREATNSENRQNNTIDRANTSGFVGVSFSKDRKKWQAQIEANGSRFFLGRFNSAEAAAHAYAEAKARLHTFSPAIRGTQRQLEESCKS